MDCAKWKKIQFQKVTVVYDSIYITSGKSKIIMTGSKAVVTES